METVIKNTEEKEYAFYVIRKLTVSLKKESQGGNTKEINRLNIMIHDNGAIVLLDKIYAVRAIKEKSACIFTII